jgi:arylsulfatase A-like enzyme
LASAPFWTVLSLVLGLVSGFIEVAFQAGRQFLLGDWVLLSPHVLWMAPLAQTVLLGFLGLLGEVLWRLRPSRSTAQLILGALIWGATLPEVLGQPYLDPRAAALLALGVAVQLSRRSVDRLSSLARVAPRALLGLGLLFGLALVAVPTGLSLRERAVLARKDGPDGRPNVLLIILDTVRAASLSLYGYSKPTTPFLEDLAREGARFDQAYAPSSWTLPTHASMLTGRWPHELSADWNRRLDETFPTLPECFLSAGFATGAFVANYEYTAPETGLDRGFTRYSTFRPSLAEIVASSSVAGWLSSRLSVRRAFGYQEVVNRKLAGHVRQEFLDWVDGLQGRPFFAMLNLFDAHEPYLPPAPHDTIFGDGRIGFHPKTVFTPRAAAIREGDRKALPLEEQKRQQTAYDGALRYMDGELELLVDELRHRDILDNTIVVITSDHGEAFGEGGEFMHGPAFSALTTHVPLIIRYPSAVAGRAIAREVSLRDLPATLLDLTGFAAGELPGRSLGPLMGADSTVPAASSPVLSTFWGWTTTGSREWSLIRSGLRYEVSHEGKEGIFDLRRDPIETTNLLTSNSALGLADTARALRAIIDSIRAVTVTSPRPNPWKSEARGAEGLTGEESGTAVLTRRSCVLQDMP